MTEPLRRNSGACLEISLFPFSLPCSRLRVGFPPPLLLAPPNIGSAPFSSFPQAPPQLFLPLRKQVRATSSLPQYRKYRIWMTHHFDKFRVHTTKNSPKTSARNLVTSTVPEVSNLNDTSFWQISRAYNKKYYTVFVFFFWLNGSLFLKFFLHELGQKGFRHNKMFLFSYVS